MRSIWLRARLDTAPRFCGLEIGRQRGIPKGGRTANHTPHRPRPSASRADWRSSSRCKRSRTAFTSRSRCGEYRSVYTLTHRAPSPRRSAGVEITRTSEPNGRNRNGQGCPSRYKFQTAKLGRGGQHVARDHADGRVFDFSMGSTFRAIGQSPTWNALVSEIRSEIRRDCKAFSGKPAADRRQRSLLLPVAGGRKRKDETATEPAAIGVRSRKKA